MKDLTSMCMKKSYQRGDYTPPKCPEDGTIMDEITMKCYPPCKEGVAAGPFCWNKCIPGTKPCGGALCVDENEQCTEDIRKQVMGSIEKIKKDAPQTMTGSPFNVGQVTPALPYPVCDDVEPEGQEDSPSVPMEIPKAP